jgi:hypothetical protein
VGTGVAVAPQQAGAGAATGIVVTAGAKPTVTGAAPQQGCATGIATGRNVVYGTSCCWATNVVTGRITVVGRPQASQPDCGTMVTTGRLTITERNAVCGM